MQCIWSTTANALCRKVIQNPPAAKNWHRLCSRLVLFSRTRGAFVLQPGNNLSRWVRCYNRPAVAQNLPHQSAADSETSSNHSRNPFFTSTPTTVTPDDSRGGSKTNPTIDSEFSVDGSSLTTAQLSRAAAQAVRLSFHRGEHKNAYYMVNSLRASLDPPGKGLNAKLPATARHLRFPDFKPIKFGRPVSPRLSSHALLHELIRSGLTLKAAKEAEFLIENGVKIRPPTLQATVCSLVPPNSSPPHSGQSPPDRSRQVLGPNILTLRPSMVSDQCTRYAVRLLLKAGQYRQQRTQEMYDFVIHMCLLQGEVIVGTLLFVMLVKSMQWRVEWSTQMNGQADSAHTESANESHDKADDAFRFLRDERLYPKKRLMNALLAALETSLANDPQGEESQLAFRRSLQALANLAMLLDQRKIPHPDIAPLIRTLYRCPRVKDEVWIRQNGIPVRVCAYSYFHDVLQRLIGSLPSKYPPPIIKDPQKHSFLPPLDVNAYNSLLHYALRHQLSPTLASKILHHMTNERYRPLEPDIVTYNILVRSGTLSRRSDISERALEILRRRKENMDHGITTRPPRQKNTGMQISGEPPRVGNELDSTPCFSTALHRLDSEALEIPDDHQHTFPLSADAYTLSTYVTHLTSTGQPHIVAKILFRVLPELIIVDHPSWGQMTPEERRQLKIGSRRACLRRAVAYGPYFFTSVLNALCKAGKTGLAERVWLLAKQAERASWVPDFCPGTEPWCLPVHGYTTMIQCYAAEARVALDMRHWTRNTYNERLLLDLEGSSAWTPRTKNPHIRGWARFILQRNRNRGRLDNYRRSAGKELGLLLFHSMRSGARDIYAALMDIQQQMKTQSLSRRIDIPKPDARFFNAALELFSRQLQYRSRRSRSTRAHCRRKLRHAKVCYARSGILPRQWSPAVQKVAEQIVEAGYSVPPALRHLFVGRWAPGTVRHRQRRVLERRPFMFPPVRNGVFRPYTLHTWKSRGLPLRNRRIHQPERSKRIRAM